jgi:hypothetical protein
LAFAKGHKVFAQYVNGVLEQLRTDGGWQAAYTSSGLKAILKDRAQPRGDFSRK